jgi:hypothetical protein
MGEGQAEFVSRAVFFVLGVEVAAAAVDVEGLVRQVLRLEGQLQVFFNFLKLKGNIE